MSENMTSLSRIAHMSMSGLRARTDKLALFTVVSYCHLSVWVPRTHHDRQ